MHATSTNTTATTTPAKVVYLPFDATEFVRVSAISFKGSNLGVQSWEAYKGLFSKALQGGMLEELSATGCKHAAVLSVWTTDKKQLTAIGKAFHKVAPLAYANRSAHGRPATQEAHDNALAAIHADWLAQFKDAAPRKAREGLTCAQKMEALKAFILTEAKDIKAITAKMEELAI